MQYMYDVKVQAGSKIFFYYQAISFNAPDFIIRSLETCLNCRVIVARSARMIIQKKKKEKNARLQSSEIESNLNVKLPRKKEAYAMWQATAQHDSQHNTAVISILYANLCGVSRIVIIRTKKNLAILRYFCLFSVCRNSFCPFHTLYVYATLV